MLAPANRQIYWLPVILYLHNDFVSVALNEYKRYKCNSNDSQLESKLILHFTYPPISSSIYSIFETERSLARPAVQTHVVNNEHKCLRAILHNLAQFMTKSKKKIGQN